MNHQPQEDNHELRHASADLAPTSAAAAAGAPKETATVAADAERGGARA